MAISEQMHDWISMKLCVFFLFSSFTVSPQHLGSLPAGVLGKPLGYCCCSALACKLNRAEIDVAFLSVSQEELDETLPIICPPPTHLSPQMWWFHHARCLSDSKLYRFPWTELSLCSHVRLLLNSVFSSKARLDFHESLGFSSFPQYHSFPKSEHCTSSLSWKAP